ncbi:hypothetical protein [Streptomyces uncialis]|uniref:hypothetical protein n=1 Tax=Streptomyces uncialis TaxID=1048205 RepID=UPI0038642707|nr:hypothetical protein OG268_19690 [Streptomyces uncialis]
MREPPTGLAEAALRGALSDTYGSGLLRPAAPEAVAHPNGFVKLPLAVAADDGSRLFLHVWLTGVGDPHVHNHRWDFASSVLSGTLHNTLVETAAMPPGADEEGAGLLAVRHRPCTGGFRFATTGAQRVRVTREETVVMGRGTSYRQAARILHRVRAEPDTMTLVARGAPVRHWSDVLVSGPVHEEARRWRRVEETERRAYLLKALEALR